MAGSEKEVKPAISKQQMEKVMDRIDKGEVGLLEKVKDHFTLTGDQQKYLELYLKTKHLR